MRKITYCLIDDIQLPMLFTLGAEMQIAERMGSLDALLNVFTGEEDEAEKTLRADIPAIAAEIRTMLISR